MPVTWVMCPTPRIFSRACAAAKNRTPIWKPWGSLRVYSVIWGMPRGGRSGHCSSIPVPTRLERMRQPTRFSRGRNIEPGMNCRRLVRFDVGCFALACEFWTAATCHRFCLFLILRSCYTFAIDKKHCSASGKLGKSWDKSQHSQRRATPYSGNCNR